MSDMKIIQCIELADGRPGPFAGMYLVSYDPEALDGMGDWTWTPDRQKATHFTTKQAFEMLQAVPKKRPLRPDGKPNRPLMSFTVIIDPV